MKIAYSVYQPYWQNLSLAKIDQQMAAMPAAGVIDVLNWKEQYPTAPETTFTLAHTDEMLYVRFEVKGEVPLATKTTDLELVNEDGTPFVEGEVEPIVIVEDGVLVGANAVVIEGVHVGKNAVVAAGAIVVGDVAPNTVVAGCPARVIKVKDEKTASKTALVDALRTL